MHRYRSVLVGCGGRGQSHARGLLANPDRFELVALCDQDDARLGALAAKLGISRGYADAEAMLAAERPDVLCFATPPAVRLQLVELGVRHGVKAIAFEKPLALSLAEAHVWEDVTVTVQGSEGYARVVLGSGWEAVTRRSGGQTESGPADSSPGEPEHLRLLADWLDDSRRVHPSNLETSYQGFEILMALALSSLERRRVDLPIRGNPEAILERLRDALPDGPAAS